MRSDTTTPKATDPIQRRHLRRLCGNCTHRCSRNHAKALQEETKPEKPKDRHSDGLDKLRQEVARMAQENKIQRQFEEVREAAQERQATRPLQLRQFARQETHAGELTDEDGDKTEREADVRAQSALPNKKGTPIPQHVQLGRYNSRHRRPCDKDPTTQKSGGSRRQ